jgi:hypothetical protein
MNEPGSSAQNRHRDNPRAGKAILVSLLLSSYLGILVLYSVVLGSLLLLDMVAGMAKFGSHY